LTGDAVRIKKRYALRSDKVRDYLNMARNYVDETIFKKIKQSKWEYLEFEDQFSIVALDSTPFLIVETDSCIPHLRSQKYLNISSIVVDQGAIPYVCNGADIMYAGIVSFDKKIKKDDIVLVCEEKFNKEISIGKALINGSDFDKNKKGKAVLNLHYVGDKKWKIS